MCVYFVKCTTRNFLKKFRMQSDVFQCLSCGILDSHQKHSSSQTLELHFDIINGIELACITVKLQIYAHS